MGLLFNDRSTLSDIERFREKEGDLIIQISKPLRSRTWWVRFLKPNPLGMPASPRHVASGSSKHSIGTALDNAVIDYERFKRGEHND